MTTPQRIKVLIVEDRASDAVLMVDALRDSGFDPMWTRIETEEDFLASLDPAPDVILSDDTLPRFDAIRALQALRDRGLDTPLLMVTGAKGEDVAVEAMREGAYDYLVKDRLGRLGPAVARALGEKARREERRHTQEQLRLQASALDAAANGILITDRSGAILWANSAFARVSGYEIEEILGRNPRFLKSGEHEEPYYRDLWRSILSGAVWSGEMVNRSKDGTRYVEEQTITPVRSADGAVSHFIAIKQDVTARKHAEDAARERARVGALTADVGLALTGTESLHEMLQRCAQSMVDNLDAAVARIWTLDPNSKLLELQASAGLYTHLDGPHALIPVGQFKIGRIAQEREPHLTNDVCNDPRVSDLEWARREGMVAFAGYPLLIDDQVLGVVAMFAQKLLPDSILDALAATARHIALGIQRKQAEAQLRRVLSSSPSVLFSLELSNGDGRVRWMSENIHSLLGYEAKECLGQGWWHDRVHPEELPGVFERWSELLREGHVVNEYRFRHNDGTYRWIRDEQRVLKDSAGAPVECVGSWSDITERKDLEDQFRQSQKMEAVGRLAGGVAHDFNNLLTVILGFDEILLEGLPDDSPSRSSLEQIGRAATRASALTGQLLAFSRRQVLNPVILDLNDLLDEAARMLGRLIGEDIELTIRKDTHLSRVRADAGQIEQVIMNLVVNSRDAMPRGGKLTIETANVELDRHYARAHPEVVPGPHAMLAITDTGCGIDAKTRARIFEPFFTTKEAGKGTGLGLATVYGILKQSGGHIAVYSEPGRGSTFKVYLPIGADSAAPGRTLENEGESRRGTETILLAEDDEAVRALSRLMLERDGYHVIEAKDGEEAALLAEDREEPIHLLVTDVVMPRVSGRELAERVALTHPETKVLYLSGYSDDAIVRHGVLQANTEFLQKPFTRRALTRRVRELLDLPAPSFAGKPE